MPSLKSSRLPFRRKHARYVLVSLVAVPVSQIVFLGMHASLHLRPVVSNVTAVTAGGIPSYVLSRRWVWGRRGRSHLWRETMPFLFMTVLGLALSTLLVAAVSQWSESTLLLAATNLFAFGLLWVSRFLLLDRLFSA